MPDYLGMGPFLNNGRPYGEQGPVVSGHTDLNADLIADAARLFIPDGALVLDATYGKGAFWSGVDLSRFYLYANDTKHYTDEEKTAILYSGVTGITDHDYTEMSFGDEFWDVVVFDPPYKSGGGGGHEPMTEQYGLDAIESDTPSGHGNVNSVMDEYAEGMEECVRVLATKGLLWVKCQDFVESGKQHWMHMWVAARAVNMGLKTLDLFVLVTTKKQRMRHKTQLHARKNVSYLWVFQKT